MKSLTALSHPILEVNLAQLAQAIQQDPTKGYESKFLDQFTKNVEKVASKKTKIVVNAGGLNPKALASAVQDVCKKAGVPLKVAFTGGDNLLPSWEHLKKTDVSINVLEDGKPFTVQQSDLYCANAYLGARPIVAALEAGADIVITGRHTDASPVIAAAVYFHKWSFDEYDKLAQVLLAGHAIECGAYVTGGNTSNFKKHLNSGQYFSLTSPIAEISHDGSVIITKVPEGRGFVDEDTVKHQLVYEIQGNLYVNPDVVADLHYLSIHQVGKDRVEIRNVRGSIPPSTTKASICYKGGFQAEVHVFATGPDIAEKKAAHLDMIKHLVPDLYERFQVFEIQQYGVAQENVRVRRDFV
jgi:ribosomal protein L7Ae-like RNA K-turn-binding protein